MGLALSIFGIAFAAFCAWLTVRIVNRRERWAKRTAATLILMLAIASTYVLSLGPAILIAQKAKWGGRPVSKAYRPVMLMLVHGPKPIKSAIWWYLDFWWIGPARFDFKDTPELVFLRDPEKYPVGKSFSGRDDVWD